MASARVFAALLVLAAATAPALAAEPLGRAPAYAQRALSDVPNAAAITGRIWVPGLDDGYVPQGLAVIGNDIFISSYQSTDPKQGRGPCRLYRVRPETGAITGQLDLPSSCGHAGGLARGPAGRVFVADTREVFEVALRPNSDPSLGEVVRSIKLTGAVRGSFAASMNDALWLGTYSKEPGARLYRFSFSALKDQVGDADASASLPLPSEAQGATFDDNGRLWVSRSGSKFGELMQLDVNSGEIQARYAMPAGIEDLGFDGTGQIWAVSEAGSRRWLAWDTFYPVIFRLDLSRVR
jgi:sugar lactone lactonase YvrE